jgi:hypothetical protein
MSGTSHFWSRSLQKQILVPVPVKNILVTVSVQKNILVPVPSETNFGPGPGQKKKFGPAGAGTTLPISIPDANIQWVNPMQIYFI